MELGVKFRSNAAGSVTGVRFYKGSQNTGTHTGHLWTSAGALLASVTFSGETASGWQQARFATPVAITANTTYVISYHAPAGHYSQNTNYFANAVTNGPLTALAASTSPNGVYRYGTTPAFPNASWSSSNYWVDVVFQPAASTAMTAAISTAAPKMQTGGASLSCSPNVVAAGGSFECALTGAGAEASINADGAEGVLLPAATGGRKRGSAVFRGSVAAGAPQQRVTVTASAGGLEVQDTVTVAAGNPSIVLPPDQLVQTGTPVAFKVTADSSVPAAITAPELPAGASFDASTGEFAWTPRTDQQGVYDVKFTTGNTQQSVRITVDAGKPAIEGPLSCSPGAIASVSGKWLGPNNPVEDATGASQELGGTTVTVNDVRVPVVYAGSRRVAFVCPAGQPGETLRVLVETSAGSAAAPSATMQSATPTVLATESGQGAVYHSDSGDLAAVQDVNTSGERALPGDLLTIRATGLADGLRPAVQIGGAEAEVQSVQPAAGAAGVWEVRVTVPAGAQRGDQVPVRLRVAGADGRQVESNQVTIAVGN